MDGGRKFYRLKSKHSKPVPMQESVKVVAESEQTVEQAKEELKDESKLMQAQRGRHTTFKTW